MENFLASPGAAGAVSMGIFFTSIAVIAVGCTIAVQWRMAHQTSVDADLKKEMIQRGMSAEEIERVLKAQSKRD
jgi:hypothetical protein